ncbi:MAG: hypothetical protein AAFN77_12305 [Planctomycetota bacterium]
MTKLTTAFTAAAAFAIFSFAGAASVSAQQTFGYPATTQSQQCNGRCGGGCRLHGGGGHMQNFRDKMDHYSALNKKKFDRNDAWPRPFNCWDRRAYHNVWVPMLTNGAEQHCILSSDFFDAETNELTRVGIAKVADIMQNVPQTNRSVFVQRSADDKANQARMEQVKFTIDKFYAHLGVARVQLSNQLPPISPAAQSQAILNSRTENMAPPTIQASNGGSVAQSVGN